MKKIITVLLICVCVFMTACSNKEPVKPQSSTTFIPASTITPSVTPKPGAYQWETKDIPEPIFDTCQEVEQIAIQLSNKDIKATVVQSPLKIENYNIKETKKALSDFTLFDGWFFGESQSERASVIMYPDLGQQTSYNYSYDIVASKNFKDTQEYFSDLIVKYQGTTDKALGYTSISLQINIEDNQFNAALQQQIFEILKVVYKEEHANVLCYAPIKDGNIICEIKQPNADIVFKRDVNSAQLKFEISVNTFMFGWFEGYKGTEYTPLLGVPEKFFDIFSKEIGSFDLRAYKQLANQMLAKHYTDYECVLPDYTSGYTYSVITMDNGYHLVDLNVEGMIKQKDVKQLVCPNFMVKYTIGEINGVTTVANGAIKCGVGYINANTDIEAIKHDMFLKALPMMEMVIDGDQNLVKDFIYNESDKAYNTVKRQITLSGIEKEVVFQFEFDKTMSDAYVGYFSVTF